MDHCVELIRQVDSPNMKLLFDVYHVQIMNGDVIRRIRSKGCDRHYHTAGNPGRAELDDTQEINYPAVMRAIGDRYDLFVAQEFIPTWDDPVAALRRSDGMRCVNQNDFPDAAPVCCRCLAGSTGCVRLR